MGEKRYSCERSMNTFSRFLVLTIYKLLCLGDNMKQIFFSALLVFLSTVLNAQTDPILWRQTNGPTGGNVTSVCVDSNNTMYVSTQVAGMFRSTNKGDTWMPLNKGLNRLQAKMIISDGSEYIYAMTYYNEMLRLKSFELGWEELPVKIHDSIYINFGMMSAGRNGAIFIATSGHGIMRTTDHGDSWQELGDSAFRNQSFLYVTTARNGDIYGIQFVNGSKFNYVYRSTDNGDSWTKLPKEIPTLEDPSCFAIAPDNSIVIGTFWGYVFRSADGGNSWDQVFKHPSNHDIQFILRTDYLPNNAMFFTTHSNLNDVNQTRTGGFFRSVNNGASWELRDGTQHGESKFWISETRDGDIFHSSVPLGVIKTTDQGAVWFDKNSGLLAQFLNGVVVNSKGDIFSVTQFEMNRSTNQGDIWVPLNFISREAFRPPFLYVAANDLLFHASYYGLFRSSNDGNSWQQVLFEDTSVHSNLIYDVKQAPNGNIFASSFNTGLMVSVDKGLTWSKAPNLNPDLRYTAVACGTDNTILLSDEGSNFWLSKNGGINWAVISQDNNGCSQLEWHPSGAYIARYGFHVDISYDSGKTWTWKQFALTGSRIRCSLTDTEVSL
jgi:photosystem II stability/assembly factor-like uncharacterized protein